ncbi:CBL-interacting serine/threonine-protein kinase 11-like [Impatiens glandulifera]|uniref:CBL-interacting serine/threonine-protein kinase 11-like n=1 Tax=Impatiens glandulifera TaxID=253017 RepID=UPI001FB0F925|nr:CBL-interacting serine/threonine-protein kinase 11-like [Impatiens glandulifera]
MSKTKPNHQIPTAGAGIFGMWHNHTNTLFNKYEIRKLLGRGAFAKVYHAKSISTGQSVAIKIINKTKIAANTSSNIKREIAIMRRLHHPNIVRLFEVLATKSKIYVVMEYLKGGELFARVAKGRFDEDTGRKYFQQLISAVGFCHSRGVYHRDLKPENILIDENGNLKVSDFGLSAATDQIRQDGMLHTICGSPSYVAPEILVKKGYDGAKVDIWSCGIILYALIAGYLPFKDPNQMALYKKIYKGEYHCPKWMSSDLKQFLSRLLDTNPATRFSIDQIIQDPWFRKDYKEVAFPTDGEFTFKPDEEDRTGFSLNAFNIISFSSGLDLSCLFDDCTSSENDGERFVSTESPERIIEKVKDVVNVEKGIRLKTNKNWRMEIEGNKLNFLMELEMYRLTDNLVVVDVRRRMGHVELFNELWREKIKLKLSPAGDERKNIQPERSISV